MKTLRAAALVIVSVALLGACAGPRPSWTPSPVTSAAATEPPATTTPPPAKTAPPTTTPAAVPTIATRVAVTLTDTMRIEPGTITVAAGQPTTFVVTNAGKIPHEFTLGDAEVQDEHEQEMLEMGGMPMTHDEPNAIAVAPGETKELTYTFEAPGTSLAGCHVPGHYPAGMKATIAVSS